MVSIPKAIENLKFVKCEPKSKRCFTKEWSENPLTASEINPFLEQGYNYGILCGNGVLIIDIDDAQGRGKNFCLDQLPFFPETFTVKTPGKIGESHGWHLIYFCKDFPGSGKIKDPQTNENIGELRYTGNYTIGPGSIHPEKNVPYEVFKDVPVAEVPSREILALLGKYPCTFTEARNQRSLENRTGSPISIMPVIKNIKLRQVGKELTGKHPAHDSSTGTNFSVNPEKNIWRCWRHDSGGNAITLIAVLEGIIPCEQAKPGGLHGEKFKQTLKIAKEKYSIDIDDPKNGLNFIMTKGGKMNPGLNNALNYFDRDPSIRDMFQYNEFTGGVEFSRENDINPRAKAGDEIEEIDLVNIKVYFATALKLEVFKNIIWEAVSSIAHQNRYHPVKNYLESLSWDGVNRIDSWLIDYAGAEDSEYVRNISRILLIASIARIYEPGCKFDYMVILEGEQGFKKSTLIETLGGKWYHDINIFLNRDKDTVDAMRAAWFIEVAELAHFKKAEIEGVKAFVTRKVDRVRLAYERLTKNFPRQCVFVGSINPDDLGYLTDNTGNRRFWPVLCKKADIEGLSRVRDQLFAEALSVFKSGDFKLYMDEEIEKLAVIEQGKREVKEEWAEPIYEWLKTQPNRSDGFTLMEIAKGALDIDPAKVKWHETRSISRAMQQLGWSIKVVRVGVSFTRKYFEVKGIELGWVD